MTTSIIRREDSTVISENTNYQGFVYDYANNVCTPTGSRVVPKWKLLRNVFPELVRGKRFIDIGANSGFFCFKAVEHGCRQAVGIEAEDKYYRPVKRTLEARPLVNFAWIKGVFPDILTTTSLEGDVVMALSVLHHIFPRTSLNETIRVFEEITSSHLIIEWIDLNDDRMGKKRFSRYPEYRRPYFENLLSKTFPKWKVLGRSHKDSRFVYLVSKVT